MPSLDSTLSSLVQPLYSVLPCQAPTTSCQASVRLGQALLIPRQIFPTSSQLLYWGVKAICAASMPRHSRVTVASNLIHAASHCTGRVKRHPEHQPQLLWSKEELVSGNRKSIYTMPFELIKHIFKIFYPDERGHSNHPDQLLGVGSLVPCYDRSGNIFAYLPASVQTTRTSHALVNKSLIDELSSVVAPSRSAEEEIAPVKCHPSLPAEECAPVKHRRASKRIQRETKRN
ncbi:hypothetical protein BD769DRAFT_750153 [Suillus cothurnatus]|nr:hypothetical protein BD769DRAFT_750153 [Suillus cothurnatus]